MSGNKAVKCLRWLACVRQLSAELSAASGQQGALLCFHTHSPVPTGESEQGEGEKSLHDLSVHRSLPPAKKASYMVYGKT